MNQYDGSRLPRYWQRHGIYTLSTIYDDGISLIAAYLITADSKKWILIPSFPSRALEDGTPHEYDYLRVRSKPLAPSSSTRNRNVKYAPTSIPPYVGDTSNTVEANSPTLRLGRLVQGIDHDPSTVPSSAYCASNALDETIRKGRQYGVVVRNALSHETITAVQGLSNFGYPYHIPVKSLFTLYRGAS